jgi:signal transduction histidine kinase
VCSVAEATLPSVSTDLPVGASTGGAVPEAHLVAKVVQFSFLLRLASLLLVVVTPGDAVSSPAGLTAIGFITLSSTAGLYATQQLTGKVMAHPILLVLDVLVATGLASLLGATSPLLIYTFSTAVLIGILLPRPIATLVLAIQVSTLILVAVDQDTSDELIGILIVPICSATLGAMGILTRFLLASAEREQANVRRLSADAAIERERARLARDMHDSVAKALHGIALAAAALPAWAQKGPEQLSAKAVELQAAAESAAQDARSILVDLRTETDDRTLAQQLRVMADGLTQGGVQTILTVGGVADCDHAVKRELVAIAGEAVENIHRHSGAQNVAITCAGERDTITVTIRDDGHGFDPGLTPTGHFGLVGMRERAELVGGTLDLVTSPGRGTTVTVRTPRAAKGTP